MAPRNKKKPIWVVEKERERRANGTETVWLFGIHAVRDALMNPMRERLQLILTKNAADKLADAIKISGMEPTIVDPRKFKLPIDPNSVHQGAGLEVKPLDWGSMSDVCAPRKDVPTLLLLDRVSDPHNVGAILRSGEVFGARAIVAPTRHSAPETGSLAKTASGALERQPYIRIRNLATAMSTLRDMGYVLIGLDGEASGTLEEKTELHHDQPIALVLGAEGPGLRDLTKKNCDHLAKIDFAGEFGSLNVSNAAAIGLYSVRKSRKPQ